MFGKLRQWSSSVGRYISSFFYEERNLVVSCADVVLGTKSVPTGETQTVWRTHNEWKPVSKMRYVTRYRPKTYYNGRLIYTSMESYLSHEYTTQYEIVLSTRPEQEPVYKSVPAYIVEIKCSDDENTYVLCNKKDTPTEARLICDKLPRGTPALFHRSFICSKIRVGSDEMDVWVRGPPPTTMDIIKCIVYSSVSFPIIFGLLFCVTAGLNRLIAPRAG